MKFRRNDPCSCGSGRKYKKCCGEGNATQPRPAPDLNRLFAQAQEEQRQGRLKRAEQLYAEIVAADPRHAEALYTLGVIAIEAARHEQAVELIRRATAVDPASALYQCNLGTALYRLGMLVDAVSAYREALRLLPDFPDALANIGGVLLDLDRKEEALQYLEKAVALNPSHPIGLTNLGLLLHRLGRSRDGMYYAQKAVEVAPQFLSAIHNCAVLMLDFQRWKDAIPYFQRWVSLDPEKPQAWQGLGNCHAHLNLRHEAAQYYWKALQLKPDFYEAASNLGLCLAEGGYDEDALVLYRKVVEINPNFPTVWTNMGEALRSLGQGEASLECHNKALALDPGNQQVLWNRSLTLLSLGKLTEGWADYDQRAATGKSRLRPITHERWRGSDLAGKTILVWMEQGISDEIVFCSMLPDLLRLGAHCVVECDPRLVTLLERSFSGMEAVPRIEPVRPRTQTPDIDFQIAAGSLPRLFRTNLESFPQHQGYLVPDPARVREWTERLAALGEGLKVGICWRSSAHKESRGRHYSQLDLWGPILTTPGVQFVNLQYDECAEELDQAQRLFGTRVQVWEDMDLRNDQEGVAALISSLDLVLSANTAVSSLGGAIGAPVWVPVRGGTTWWGLGTDYCPWLPTVRVFGGEAASAWTPIIEKIASELSLRAKTVCRTPDLACLDEIVR